MKNLSFPLLKFVLGLILFLTINGRMGYMAKIDHVAIALVAALLCSFTPAGCDGIFERDVSAAACLCAVCGMRCGSAACLYYRVGDLSAVCTESALLLLLTPLLFVWKIPYAAPLAAGLFGTPGAAAAVAGGVVVYYVLAYITGNAQAFGGGGKRYHAAALQRYGNRRDRK